MLLRSLYASLIVVMACSVGPAGDKGKPKKEMENPFKNAKVGDFNSYKLSATLGDKTIEGSLKELVTAREGNNVTTKTSGSLMGLAVPAQMNTVDITMPFDPLSLAGQGAPAGKKVKFQKTGEGKEKIKVGGKEYNCTYVTGKGEADAMGISLTLNVKVWISKSVPLSGMVKTETKTNLADFVIEFVESGNEKPK